MSKTEQLDLELDATGIDEQIARLAVKAQAMAGKWLLASLKGDFAITDETVVDLLKQAAAVQHLLDLTNQRKKGG